MLTVVVASLALAAPASAADPLLSGYSGPGGGDQAVLGTEVLPGPGGSKGGSLQASARVAIPAVSAASVAAVAAAAPLTPRPVPPRRTERSAVSGPGTTRKQPRRLVSEATSPRRQEREATSDQAAFATVAYPPAAADAGTFPLPAEAVVGSLMALVALVGVAVGTARLASRRVA